MDGGTLWFVALLLYVYDSVSTRDREAVLRYSLGRVTAKLTTPTLTIGGHRIFIPNPLRPDQCDLPLTNLSLEPLSSLDRYLICRASSMYRMHQIVSVGSLTILFGLTPLVAARTNLWNACMITVGLTLGLCGFHWFAMWKNGRVLGVGISALRSDIMHVLLCPPNAVNSARRMAGLRHPRHGVLPCLRTFSRYDAEKYEREFQSVQASA